MSLNDIKVQASECTSCTLHCNRKYPVPGEGPETAEIVIVGEAPGNEEDLSGKPFVGPSGKLLDRILSDSGIQRENVFVTNVVKCRPEQNQKPTSKEIRACRGLLKSQLSLIKPKVIVTLGRTAAEALSGHYGPLAGLQSLNLSAGITGLPIPMITAYHPNYLLRLLSQDKTKARQVYDDFLLRFKMAQAICLGQTVDRFFGEEEIDLGDL